jgi:hypothetical protein
MHSDSEDGGKKNGKSKTSDSSNAEYSSVEESSSDSESESESESESDSRKVTKVRDYTVVIIEGKYSYNLFQLRINIFENLVIL